MVGVGSLLGRMRDQNLRLDLLDDGRYRHQPRAVEDNRTILPAEPAELGADQLSASRRLGNAHLYDLVERNAWTFSPEPLGLLPFPKTQANRDDATSILCVTSERPTRSHQEVDIVGTHVENGRRAQSATLFPAKAAAAIADVNATLLTPSSPIGPNGSRPSIARANASTSSR